MIICSFICTRWTHLTQIIEILFSLHLHSTRWKFVSVSISQRASSSSVLRALIVIVVLILIASFMLTNFLSLYLLLRLSRSFPPSVSLVWSDEARFALNLVFNVITSISTSLRMYQHLSRGYTARQCTPSQSTQPPHSWFVHANKWLKLLYK